MEEAIIEDICPFLIHAIKYFKAKYFDVFDTSNLLSTIGTFYSIWFHLRYQTLNKYRIVKQFKVEDTQHITTFSAINGFYSCILFILWVYFEVICTLPFNLLDCKSN